MAARYSSNSQTAMVSSSGPERRAGLSTGQKVALGVIIALVIATIIGVTVYFTVFHNKEVT